jgi:hypothetical protein
MLNGDQVRPNEGYVIQLAKRAHNTAMVDARNQDGEEVIQESGVFLKVEREGLVVTTEQE